MQSVDNVLPCGQPFQEAAAVLVDPEDEPEDVDDFDAEPGDEPEPDESEEDDDDDDSTFFSVFFSPAPLSFAPLSFAPPSFGDDAVFAASRLSLR